MILIFYIKNQINVTRIIQIIPFIQLSKFLAITKMEK